MTTKEIYESIDQSKISPEGKQFLQKVEKGTQGFTIENKKLDKTMRKIYSDLKERKPEALKDVKVKTVTKTETVPTTKAEQKKEPTKKTKTVKRKVKKATGKKKNTKPTKTPSTPKGDKKEHISTRASKLAKKEGISFKEARAKISKVVKKEKAEAVKQTEKELDKLLKFVRKDSFEGEEKFPKVYGKQNPKTTSLGADAVRKAKPKGRRVSEQKGETTNQYGTFKNKTGRVYYEHRDNRSDRNSIPAPKGQYKYQGATPPYLEAGGTLPTPFGQAGLVGETGTLNEVDLFAMGGDLPQGVHQYYANTYNPAYTTPHGYAKGGEINLYGDNNTEDFSAVLNEIYKDGKLYKGEAFFVNGFNGYESTPDDGYLAVYDENLRKFIYLTDRNGKNIVSKGARGSSIDLSKERKPYKDDYTGSVYDYAKGGEIKNYEVSVRYLGSSPREYTLVKENLTKSSAKKLADKINKERKYNGKKVQFAISDVALPFEKGGKTQGYNDKLDESLGNRDGVEPMMMQSFKDRRDESKGMEKSMGRRAYQSVGTMDKMAKGGKIGIDGNTKGAKKYEIFEYLTQSARTPDNEYTINVNDFDKLIKKITKRAKDKKIPHIEVDYGGSYLGSINERRNYRFQIGRGFLDNPLQSKMSYINNQVNPKYRMAKGGIVKVGDLVVITDESVSDEGAKSNYGKVLSIKKEEIYDGAVNTLVKVKTNDGKVNTVNLHEVKKLYAKGGKTDDVIMIKLGGDKKFPYYIKKIDTTHIAMANNKDGVDIVTPSNILQHRGERYYDDVRSWLKGGKSPNGKSYDSDYYAKGGEVDAFIMSYVKGVPQDDANLRVDTQNLVAKLKKGGKLKQGYNDQLDESLGMRKGNRRRKMQNYKDRRDESKAMERSMGRRAYASVGMMDKGRRRRMAKGGELKGSLRDILIKKFNLEDGRDIDNYQSDLYVLYTPEIKKFLDENLDFPRNMRFFTDNITKRRFIDIPFVANKSYKKGGKIGFDALAKKVAKRYEGKKVPRKFQKEYGKRYSKEEAMEVGDKVASKVYRQQQK
tara:strand:+ start:831 stop:3953 length:3123 start_codon:yes stop_codon:yes gene_type:complete